MGEAAQGRGAACVGGAKPSLGMMRTRQNHHQGGRLARDAGSLPGASANGRLPANARQIMYAARPKIQRMTDKQLNDQYFTQVLLPDYIAARRASTGTSSMTIADTSPSHIPGKADRPRHDRGQQVHRLDRGADLDGHEL